MFYPLMPFFYGQWTAHAIVLNKPLLCLMLGSVIVTNSGALMALHLNGINSLGIVLVASLARAILGLGVGLIGSYFVAKLMQGLLYGVGTIDPIVLIGVAVVLTSTAFLACYLPARRAMRVDPMAALRYE